MWNVCATGIKGKYLEMKVFVRTYGCKTNQYESQVMKELSVASRCQTSNSYNEADIAVINSCAVTQRAERDVYKFIRRIFRESNRCKKVFVVGCYAEYIKKNNLQKIFFERLDSDIEVEFLGTQEKYNFLDKVDDNFSKEKITSFFNHSWAYVKIQDGCDSFCSYCIVPYLRNKLYSKPVKSVVEEVNGLVRNGYKKVVLVGTHIGKYFSEGKDLVDLCREILSNNDKVELVFSSLEPNEIDVKFLEFYKEYKNRIFPHFHIPLQSGDNFVLSSMRRKYSVEDYEKKVVMLRKCNPEVIISSDVIVGYPEETKEAFLNTVNFVQKLKLNWVHVFPYSPRLGTLSYQKYGNFTVKDLKQRVVSLCEVSTDLGEKHYKKLCQV